MFLRALWTEKEGLIPKKKKIRVPLEINSGLGMYVWDVYRFSWGAASKYPG